MVLEYFKPHLGGVETLFDHLAQELSKAGHQVTILTSNHTGKLPALENVEGVFQLGVSEVFCVDGKRVDPKLVLG